MLVKGISRVKMKEILCLPTCALEFCAKILSHFLESYLYEGYLTELWFHPAKFEGSDSGSLRWPTFAEDGYKCGGCIHTHTHTHTL